MTGQKEQALALVQDAVSRAKLEHKKCWLEMKDEHGFEHSGEHLRKFGSAFKWLEENDLVDFSQIKVSDYDKPNYKETTEITKDGSHKSDKLIEMNEAQGKDETFLLEAHGFDADIWEITGARNSIFNVNAKGGITKTLYSSKITVKKKIDGFNIDKLIEKFNSIKPIKVKRPTKSSKRMLSVAFVDQHFGINTFSHYERKLSETLEIFESREWDTIYIPIGNDLLHNNNHKGQTANGTQIESVDMDFATEEAYKFYTTLIDSALTNSVNVIADYIPGNHDSDITWMFTKMLAKLYPQVKWNTSIDAKKMFRWENILLVNLHGDKGLNRVAESLIKEYRDMMVNANTVEIHSGHLHSEKVIDKYGIMVRTLPTDALTDQWHKDNTFEGAVKVSQIFEYNENMLKNIHYV